MSEFDVFLCHNSQDKPEVIKIARQLQQQGFKPWLDIWELPPGVSWQERLEEQIEQIKSAAVFVGNSGFGPWQKREMRAFLSEFVERGIPVIPVLLEDAPKKPKLPIFLRSLTWVDFRHNESNPMGRLVWGITQVKPDNFYPPQSSVTESKFQSFTENLGNGIELEMIAIPGGHFLMGSPEGEGYDSEKPQHEVTIKSFYMGKFPITQAQYQQVMEQNPSRFKDRQRPVECVSWDSAKEFCQRLSKLTQNKYVLPSEAEWEYACRARTNTPYHFGETITNKLANYRRNIKKATSVEKFLTNAFGLYNTDISQTNSVGKFSPNAFGLYDIHGNVWEWCEDDWHDNYENAPTEGEAWLSRKITAKVVRGGSWLNDSWNCRSACRNNFTRDYRYGHIGFRVVCIASRTT